ncbi:hypothetical protein [Paenibacillus vandeheii]
MLGATYPIKSHGLFSGEIAVNKYGEVAVRTIYFIMNGEETHPLSAWKK